MRLLILTLLLTIPLAARQKEAPHRDAWAAKHGGKTEVKMPDGSICDIITATHAIEVEHAYNWKESIGQSLWYAFQSNKKAGILIILEKEEDQKHLLKLNSIIKHNKLPITIYTTAGSHH